MVPVPLVIVTLVPAVSVAAVSVLPVVLPISSWPLVKDVALVPPLATGRVPLTWVAKPILPQAGAVVTPPEISALPVATSASLDRVVEAEA